MDTTLLAIIGSGALAAVVSGVFNLIVQRNAQKLAVKKELDCFQKGSVEALRYLLFDNIKCHGETYIKAGKITGERYKDLKDAHKIYHDSLNGNGYLDRIISEVEKLDIE